MNLAKIVEGYSPAISIDTVFKLNHREFTEEEEKLGSYQVYVDACICEREGYVSIKAMMVYNHLPFSYYANNIGYLLADCTLVVSI